jgi:hypothetical protein
MNMRVCTDISWRTPEIFSILDIDVNDKFIIALGLSVMNGANLWGRMMRIIGTMPSLTMSSVPFPLS